MKSNAKRRVKIIGNNEIVQKLCPDCEEWLAESTFNFHFNKAHNVFAHRCIECTKKYVKAKYRNNMKKPLKRRLKRGVYNKSFDRLPNQAKKLYELLNSNKNIANYKWCSRCDNNTGNFVKKIKFLKQRGKTDGLTEICIDCINIDSDVRPSGRASCYTLEYC